MSVIRHDPEGRIRRLKFRKRDRITVEKTYLFCEDLWCAYDVGSEGNTADAQDTSFETRCAARAEKVEVGFLAIGEDVFVDEDADLWEQSVSFYSFDMARDREVVLTWWKDGEESRLELPFWRGDRVAVGHGIQ